MRNKEEIEKLKQKLLFERNAEKIYHRLLKNKALKGDPGKTPQYGVDFFMPEERNALLVSITPKKGVDYFDGAPGKIGKTGNPGIPGKTPVKGKDYFDGKDGKSVTASQVADELKNDQDFIDAATGPRGPKGKKGDKGEKGDKPKHQWDGTKLRFENPSGSWGKYVDLQGLSGYTIESSGGIPTDAPNLISGTYTPTLTNGTNVAASTAYQCQYMRVGNTVSVSGKMDIDTSAVGVYEVGISLPVASNFGAMEDCAGTGVGTTTSPGASDVMWVMADTTNDRASLNGNDNDTGNHTHYFQFIYQII